MAKQYGGSKFRFGIFGAPYEIAVESLKANESISDTFEVNLWLISEQEIDPDAVIQREAVLTVVGDDDRHFHGAINHFMISGRNGRFFTYQARLVPSIWFLSLNKNFRVFQKKSVVEIVEELLYENNVLSDSYDFRLFNEYDERRYCTQYGESDMRFISRLLEEEGIFFFFEHFEDKHVVVFADDTIAYRPIDGEATIRYQSDDGLVPDSEVIDGFGYTRAVRPGTMTQRNYNFKRASLDLTVRETGETHLDHEVYEFPCPYGHTEKGEALARVRVEEAKTLEESAQGTSNCPRFVAGFTFGVSDHDFRKLNARYLLVSVEHTGSQSHVSGEYSGIGGDFRYSNEFLAIPAAVTMRPERTIKKPFVPGIQSAFVVGPPGEEIYTDEYGRIKVQFHWDREGKKDGRSSCWLRVNQPWSGTAWGVVSIPRVGDEVLVSFVGGDPDHPVLMGSVNNSDSPALYPLPANKSQSGIKTRSTPRGGGDNFHELRFEDQKGREEIYLRSEKDWNILVKNDKTQIVGHDETRIVQNNRRKTVGVDQCETIGNNKSIQVCANHTESIGANMTVTVGSIKTETVFLNSMENVGLAKELTVGGGYAVSVVGAMNTGVGLSQFEEVGLDKVMVVGGTLKISAKNGVEIVCGGSSFKMDNAGNITVNGTLLDFSGTSHIKLASEQIDMN